MNTQAPVSSYDLTISVVSYNTKELTRRCLQAVRDKTQDIRYQVIVVDNESKDGTPEMIEAEFPEVTLIRSGKNRGFSSATNLALRQAAGRYFLLLGADTALKNDALSMLVAFLDEHPDTGIASPQLYYPDGRVQTSHYPFRYPEKRAMREVAPRIREIKTILGLRKIENRLSEEETATVPDEPIQVQRPRGVCFMIRMACVKEIGPMDSNLFIFADEVDWAWRAKQAGWKRYMVPFAEVYHENHASVSKEATLMKKVQMQSVYYFFYKHFGFNAWLRLRAGNLVGALLALLLSLMTSVLGSKRSKLSATEHFTEFKALLVMALLTKKVLPPDAV